MRRFALALSALALAAAPLVAQAPEPGPKAGEMAPDFTLAGATKDGVMKTPISLSKFKGQTVVIAFFPKARTTGCTAQMTHYRDKWAEIFNSGRGVTVIGISTDADTTLANWAKEANFPMLFASDIDGKIGSAYGAYNGKMENRLLYVVGPDGKIASTTKPFKPMVEDSYTELANQIKKAGSK
jgi:peroxiredoxin Q/BCP